MKILLDESIDIRFKKSFPPQHEVYTVKDMNWTGNKNGKLIELLAENNFDYGLFLIKTFLTSKTLRMFLHNYCSRCIQKYPETT